ncbi:hypothetical protein GCM10017687_29220 [Streptomyces echinatus]|uniref:hypothetical protein n=1 Tax=Streptomyces echinatus TaxID=67293 RepID=UPI0031EC1B39
MSDSAPDGAEQAEWFAGPVRGIARPWREGLARRLAAVHALDREERDVLLEAGHTALLTSLHAKLTRLFLVELHALRMAQGVDPAGPGTTDADTGVWAAFIEQAGAEGYLDKLAGPLPRCRSAGRDGGPDVGRGHGRLRGAVRRRPRAAGTAARRGPGPDPCRDVRGG